MTQTKTREIRMAIDAGMETALVATLTMTAVLRETMKTDIGVVNSTVIAATVRGMITEITAVMTDRPERIVTTIGLLGMTGIRGPKDPSEKIDLQETEMTNELIGRREATFADLRAGTPMIVIINVLIIAASIRIATSTQLVLEAILAARIVVNIPPIALSTKIIDRTETMIMEPAGLLAIILPTETEEGTTEVECGLTTITRMKETIDLIATTQSPDLILVMTTTKNPNRTNAATVLRAKTAILFL